jgi:urease accessory protein
MRPSKSGLTFLLTLLPAVAFAHTGTAQATGFMHGFAHPMGGADHLLAMVAVGLWASQIGGRALWAVPSVFVAVMTLGGFLGFYDVPVPFVEGGILVSVLILGVLIAGAFSPPLAYSALVVGIFAIFHGHAHGAEMPTAMGAASYTAGFVMATAILHSVGMGLGMLLQKTEPQTVNRLAGSAIALGGIYLAVS